MQRIAQPSAQLPFFSVFACVEKLDPVQPQYTFAPPPAAAARARGGGCSRFPLTIFRSRFPPNETHRLITRQRPCLHTPVFSEKSGERRSARKPAVPNFQGRIDLRPAFLRPKHIAGSFGWKRSVSFVVLIGPLQYLLHGQVGRIEMVPHSAVLCENNRKALAAR